MKSSTFDLATWLGGIKQKPVIAALIIALSIFLTANAFIEGVQTTAEHARWSWAKIEAAGAFCSDSYDWLSERVNWLSDEEVEIKDEVKANGPYWQSSYCPDQSEVNAGGYVTLDWTILSTGTEPLRDIWLATYWQSDNPIPPENIEYIPNAASLFIDGQPQTLGRNWQRDGHHIDELKPGQLLSLRYTVRVNDTAPVGAEVKFPVKMTAEGFSWTDCDATLRVAKSESV